MTYFTRAYRFYQLNREIPFSKLVFVTISHNFFLSLLPLRLGELAYIKQLKKHGIEVTKSVSDLVTVRIYDFVVLAVFFFVLLTLGINNPTVSSLSIFIITALLLFSYYFIFHTRQLYNFLYFIFGKIKYFHKVKKVILDVFEHSTALSTYSKLRLLLTSFFVWLFSFLPWVFIITVLTQANIKEALVVAIIALIASFVPIHPPGGVGTIEGSWLIGLLLVGVSYGMAVNISLFIHSIFLIQIILLYGLSLLFENYSRPSKALE
jgi:uncharacterized protein (TIRG00374 family)